MSSSPTGPIIFNLEKPRRQLIENGVVVTFREQDRTTGPTWWRETRTGPKQGEVVVEQLDPVCPHGTGSALEPWRQLSGFDSVHEWQQAIRATCGRMPAEGWLYRVVNVS